MDNVRDRNGYLFWLGFGPELVWFSVGSWPKVTLYSFLTALRFRKSFLPYCLNNTNLYTINILLVFYIILLYYYAPALIR